VDGKRRDSPKGRKKNGFFKRWGEKATKKGSGFKGASAWREALQFDIGEKREGKHMFRGRRMAELPTEKKNDLLKEVPQKPTPRKSCSTCARGKARRLRRGRGTSESWTQCKKKGKGKPASFPGKGSAGFAIQKAGNLRSVNKRKGTTALRT